MNDTDESETSSNMACLGRVPTEPLACIETVAMRYFGNSVSPYELEVRGNTKS